METRLYAEDPPKGFLPSIGSLDTFDLGDAYRIDTGVEEGAVISPFYDPTIEKVIAWGADRDAARRSLSATLADTAIWPLKTNAGFLVKALEHPAFVAATLDTGLIARRGSPDPARTAVRRRARRRGTGAGSRRRTWWIPP